jgi:hypothetical protein
VKWYKQSCGRRLVRKFPICHLQREELATRGDIVTLVHEDENAKIDMMAVMCLDSERIYFISTTSSAVEGAAYSRTRWSQGPAGPERFTFSVPQPRVAAIYYSACAQIDRHNRCRQDDLMLERKYVTRDWSMRVNLSLLGMRIVDALLLHSGARDAARTMLQHQIYKQLALELIDNTFDHVGLRRRGAEDDAATVLVPTTGVGPHATPT